MLDVSFPIFVLVVVLGVYYYVDGLFVFLLSGGDLFLLASLTYVGTGLYVTVEESYERGQLWNVILAAFGFIGFMLYGITTSNNVVEFRHVQLFYSETLGELLGAYGGPSVALDMTLSEVEESKLNAHRASKTVLAWSSLGYLIGAIALCYFARIDKVEHMKSKLGVSAPSS